MTSKTKTKIHEKNDFKCFYCGEPLIKNHPNTTVDHIIPKAMGGRNEPNNLVSCCVKCNSEKAQLLPSEWIKRIEFRMAEAKKAMIKRKKQIAKIKTLVEKEV